MAKDPSPKTIYLKDYQVPEFLIDKTELDFDIYPGKTTVRSKLHIQRNSDSTNSQAALELQGQEMTLLDVSIDGVPLSTDQYSVDEQSLTIQNVPERFVLSCTTEIIPEDNTSLEGLYKSRTMYCTQCEAEGFRKITYYLDRPDVMSEFVTRVAADKSQFPILLSNGNPLEQGDLPNGRHYAVWHDPFKKPAYLFALVAGDLACIDDSFTTGSGREVALKIFVEPKDLDKCDHALDSLKRSMRWDEEVYGREYDLDIFMIVAVDDFNMGAMENKGLNIFNTSCVLAAPQTTTDAGFQRVEGVVAHEYFHNWSGNRVTCRDWFQLSLKEGFTVYRDAEFSADMNSRTVKRIEDVSFLRTHQFAEDAGPMAHPIRPESFIEISNFYTLTIYEKGSEIVRMIANLLGPEDFRKGTDLYFDRHDGQAVTTEDFVAAMEAASGRDLSQFKRWYSQAGTPEITVTEQWHENSGDYTLHFTQSCRPTSECQKKLSYHIPIAMGLIGDAGELAVHIKGQDPAKAAERLDNCAEVIELTQPEQSITFTGLPEKPVPSLLRGFSAPVKLLFDYSRDDLAALIARDSDGFCRWDACQQLAVQVIFDAMAALESNQSFSISETFVLALGQVVSQALDDASVDRAMVANMLTLPAEAYLAELVDVADVDAIHQARDLVAVQLAKALQGSLWQIVDSYDLSAVYEANARAFAERSLKNIALGLLVKTGQSKAVRTAKLHFDQANNMTDQAAALQMLVNSSAASTESAQALADFYQRWQDEALVVNQWLQVQAACPLEGTLSRVQELMSHPAFDAKNPNKLRSVIGGFCNANPVNFHNLDGSGYAFLREQILILNKQNPQIASRLLTPLTRWRKYDESRQALMRKELEKIAAEPELSKDVFEVVSKSLANNS